MKSPIIQLIDGAAGAIETASLGCDLAGTLPKRAMLILHPHPLHGGTMGNKVVTTIARAARDADLATVAFNFRGAGESEGVWDEGRGELDDATVVATRMIEQGVTELLLAGFSFGASIAARLIPRLTRQNPDLVIPGLTQIAPAVTNFPVDDQEIGETPTLVLFNLDDEVVESSAMHVYVERLTLPRVIHADGGHFFHGQLTRLKKDLQQQWQRLGWI